MANELYFIPILAKALRQSDPKAAFLDAFDTIKTLGSEPEYQEGYHQFIRFMDVFSESVSANGEPKLIQDQTAFDPTSFDPDAHENLDQFMADYEAGFVSKPYLDILIEKEGKEIEKVSYYQVP